MLESLRNAGKEGLGNFVMDAQGAPDLDGVSSVVTGKCAEGSETNTDTLMFSIRSAI